MTANTITVSRPLTITNFQTGKTYQTPDLRFVQTNLFFEVAALDNVYVKTPSDRGFADYTKYIQHETPDPDDIRRHEELERFANFDQLARKYPDIAVVQNEFQKEYAHYLLLHRLQQERLSKYNTVHLPNVRFIMLHKETRRRFRLFRAPLLVPIYRPAIVQAKVEGASLYDMYDLENERLRSEWQPHLLTIKSALSPWVNSDLSRHINWNIKNFIFNIKENKLYYVDLTTTLAIGRANNEHNLQGVREEFV